MQMHPAAPGKEQEARISCGLFLVDDVRYFFLNL
jgi:hypothetical protein